MACRFYQAQLSRLLRILNLQKKRPGGRFFEFGDAAEGRRPRPRCGCDAQSGPCRDADAVEKTVQAALVW